MAATEAMRTSEPSRPSGLVGMPERLKPTKRICSPL